MRALGATLSTVTLDEDVEDVAELTSAALRINFEVRHSGFVALLRGSVSESLPRSSVELPSDGVAVVLGE